MSDPAHTDFQSSAFSLQPSFPWLVGLLQAGDSFYPTGSYAHSFGLEGLVQEGVVRDRATLRDFVFLSAMPALRHTELPLAAHAWRALGGRVHESDVPGGTPATACGTQALPKPDWPHLGEICVLSAALKTAREARAAAENIGRQRAELLATLHGHALARDYLRRAAAGAWPFSSAVSAALEGRVLGAPLTAVLAGSTYATLAALLSASMKLLRLGQQASQSLLTEALAAAPALIAAAETVPFDEIGWFNPWLDIAAARHESADARMFIS